MRIFLILQKNTFYHYYIDLVASFKPWPRLGNTIVSYFPQELDILSHRLILKKKLMTKFMFRNVVDCPECTIMITILSFIFIPIKMKISTNQSKFIDFPRSHCHGNGLHNVTRFIRKRLVVISNSAKWKMSVLRVFIDSSSSSSKNEKILKLAPSYYKHY